MLGKIEDIYNKSHPIVQWIVEFVVVTTGVTLFGTPVVVIIKLLGGI